MQTRKIGVVVLTTILLSACSKFNFSSPYQEQANRIDSVLTVLNKNERFNGGVLITKGDEMVIHKAYGLADFESNRKLDPSTVFQSASVSKTFTATAVFQLIEAGKLSLEDSLIKFFPNLPYSSIQLKHLLGHTSGLYPYNPLFRDKWDHNVIATNKDIIKMYETEQPESFFEPGTEFAYSNVGYVFLASIVEQVSGVPFQDYLEQSIFNPLEMDDTRVYTLLSEDTIDNFANEHILDPLTGRYRNPIGVGYHSYLYYLHGKLGDDKVATTLSDLLRWKQALFDHNFLGAHSSSAFTLSNGLIPEDKRHSNFDFGMGFQLDSLENYGRLIYHNGGEPGLRVRFHYYKDLDLTVILYLNANRNYTKEVKEVILAIMNDEPYELPKKSIAIEVAKVAIRGIREMEEVVNTLKEDTTSYYLKESEINDIAGIFWSQEMYDQGMEVLELNYDLFPESVGAVYTYGEGYMETNRMDLAIPYFKKALELMLQHPVDQQKPQFIEYLTGLIEENG